jgi:OPA family sugar phosphate sensor protein UhpC-like MFS transporter
MKFLDFFKMSKPSEPITDPNEVQKKYSRLRWQVFLSATIGYGLYYVCRLSLNVIKKPIVDAGVLSEG